MGPLSTYMYGHTSLDNLHVHLHVLITGHNYYILYCWSSPYTVGLLPIGGLLPIQLAFSLYCWPSFCTIGLLPILLAFSLYCWPSPYMYGHTSLDNLHVHVHVLITGHNYYILYCWPTAYTVGLLPIQLAFSL